MSDKCHGFRRRIADSFTGPLSEQDQRQLQEHLSTCAPCRDYLQALRQEDTSLVEYFAGIDEDIADRQERALQRIECFPTNERTDTISLWRRIMKSRYGKLATAAALIVFAAAAWIILDRSTSPAYAITDLPRQLEQARTIHVRGWHYFPEYAMPDGSEVPPSAIDNWTDVENARSRYTTTTLTSGADGVKVGVSEVIHDGPSWMRIDHGPRSVVYFRPSEYEQKLGVRRISKLISGDLFGDITQLSNAVVVGAERIDGVACDIWQSDDAHGGRWRQWLSADTGRLARAQILRKVNSGQWKVATDYSLIEYNVEPPEGTFAPEPPEGYTARNSPETAYFVELDGGHGGWSDEHWHYSCGPKVAFALADGSIVLGWQSFDPKDEEKQVLPFADVTFGGPLPKLPVEFYALKPAEGPSKPLYTGYHLAFTRKQGRSVEWSLYVPDGTPPADVQVTGYEMLCRWNLESAQHFTIHTIDHMTVMPEFTIDTTAEFDEWVLGAMAELSGDGKAPADVTYQKVIDLAQQVRTSVAP